MTDKAYIPSEKTLPEITVKAVLLGVGLSALLAGANAYLGLKVGMTVSASIPAAVLSMAALRLFRTSNILENNQVQTAASAGESLAAGAIFTLPALVLLGYWTGFGYLEVTGIALVGGVLGVLFSIPLRRTLIVDQELTFPEGVATAEVLVAGDEGGQGVRTLALAGVAAGLLKLSQTGFKLLSGAVTGGITKGSTVFAFGGDLSAALLAVGYIVRMNVAVLVFTGGVIAWCFGIPLYARMHGLPVGADGQALAGYDAAITIWSTKVRYMGVGAMFVGGIWALVALARPLVAGVRSSLELHRRLRAEQAAGLERTEHDLSFKLVVAALVVLVPLLVGLYLHLVEAGPLGISGGQYGLTICCAVALALVAGFLFSAVAGYMAGLVGSSNNPISGVTISTVLVSSLLLMALLGGGAAEGERLVSAAATAILIGAVVCCAAAISGDNLQDLKAGQLVGATPYRQQVMQILGVIAAALVIAPILNLLFQAYGFADHFPRPGMDPSQALAAPQATLMKSVAFGVFARDLEWGMMSIGACIAVIVIIIDGVLKARGSTFRAPVLAVAVGIYLPVELTVPIFMGGLIAALTGHASRNGLLLASGLIAGEALMGIFLAIPFALAQRTDVLALRPAWLEPHSGWLGVVVLLLFALWLYRGSTAEHG